MIKYFQVYAFIIILLQYESVKGSLNQPGIETPISGQEFLILCKTT